MRDLRREYLFDLAHICHIDARSVDALRYHDFCTYILHIDAYHEARNKPPEGDA